MVAEVDAAGASGIAGTFKITISTKAFHMRERPSAAKPTLDLWVKTQGDNTKIGLGAQAL